MRRGLERAPRARHARLRVDDDARRLDGVRERAEGSSECEWKGRATYWDVVVDGRRLRQAGWSYESPAAGYEHLRGAVAFYPGRVDRALVDGEQVRPQPGDFYGGWITDDVVGPFKGDPGTWGW